MKQYGGDNLSLPSSPSTSSSPSLTSATTGGEKTVYASQCLKQFDITEYRMVFNDLAVHVYQALIKLIQDRLQPMIGTKYLICMSSSFFYFFSVWVIGTRVYSRRFSFQTLWIASHFDSQRCTSGLKCLYG